MSKVLYAWELGANLGHILPLAAIAKKLNGDRHEAVFAVLDVGMAATALGADAFVIQAPVWPRYRHYGAHGGLASYTDILAAVGFADPAKLAAMMRAWQALVQLVRPDAIVADHAPALLAAVNGSGIPVVAVGSAFAMPPVEGKGFPPLRADSAPAMPETRLLQSLRAAETACGQTPSTRFLEPFRTAGRVVFGVPELDPYRPFRREPVVAPPGGLPPAQPLPPAPRLFAYIGDDAPNFETLAQALSMLKTPVEAYFRGEVGPLPEFLRLRGLTVHDAPPVLSEVLPRVSHVLTQGGAMTSAAVFAAGRPQLVLPPHEEAELNLGLLQQYGVAARLRLADDPETLAVAIDAFVSDHAPAERAQEIGRRIAYRQLADGAEVAAAQLRALLPRAAARSAPAKPATYAE